MPLTDKNYQRVRLPLSLFLLQQPRRFCAQANFSSCLNCGQRLDEWKWAFLCQRVKPISERSLWSTWVRAHAHWARRLPLDQQTGNGDNLKRHRVRSRERKRREGVTQETKCSGNEKRERERENECAFDVHIVVNISILKLQTLFSVMKFITKKRQINQT